jgi:hypothetical protein
MTDAARPSAPQKDAWEGCPCTLTTPCHPRCTCVNSYSSSGCRRYCKYGSLEQRTRKAEYVARIIDSAAVPVPRAAPSEQAIATACKAFAETGQFSVPRWRSRRLCTQRTRWTAPSAPRRASRL